MVEHLVCNQAVVGSNPVASTIRHKGHPNFGDEDSSTRGLPEGDSRGSLKTR